MTPLAILDEANRARHAGDHDEADALMRLLHNTAEPDEFDRGIYDHERDNREECER